MYDGADGLAGAADLNPVGPGGIDLTSGETQDAVSFTFTFTSSDQPGTLVVTIHTDAANFCSSTAISTVASIPEIRSDYTVFVNNGDDTRAVAATGITFAVATDSAPVFVVGSVTSTQGTVNTARKVPLCVFHPTFRSFGVNLKRPVSISSVNTLTGLVVDDRLQIEMSIPACNGYLALEAAALFGAQPSECGGRTLTADVVDATLGVAVNGLTAPIGDGVGANDAAFLNDFPFLAPPNP